MLIRSIGTGAVLLVALAVAGCGAFRGQTPAPTPADFAGIVANFTRRGITVQEAFDRLRPAIDACARSFVSDPETFESIDAAPFVLAGQGPWASNFDQALRASIEEAAQ